MTEIPARSPALLAWLRMARIVAKTHRDAAERLKEYNLSNAQFDVIAQVGSANGPTQQELAERLLVTQGNVCQLLNGLEKQGLVERRKSGRSNHLFLTSEGNDVFRESVPAQEAWQAERLDTLDLDEQKELLRLLRKVERAQKRA